jgi:DME family drug/metabolite transporter
VTFRAGLAFLLLLAALGLGRRAWLRIDWRDLPFFALFGLVGVAIFYIVYAYAINLAGMAVAAVLLYTAPAWVVVLSWRLFAERVDGRKIVALLLTLAGCFLIVGAYDLAHVSLNLAGIVLSLASGLTYGLYIIFNKYALRKYSPWTVLTYAIGIGSALLLFTQSPATLVSALASPAQIGWLLAMAIVPTLGGNLLFVSGLRYLPAGVASIVATLEPVMAALLAFLVLGERLQPPQLVGGVMVVGAVLLIYRRK